MLLIIIFTINFFKISFIIKEILKFLNSNFETTLRRFIKFIVDMMGATLRSFW